MCGTGQPMIISKDLNAEPYVIPVAAQAMNGDFLVDLEAAFANGDGQCRLVVVAIESGGRWSHEAFDFIWQFAGAKAVEAQSHVTQQVAFAWERRRTGMMSTPCAMAFAASLVEPLERDSPCQTVGETPSLAEVLTHDPRQSVRFFGP